MKKRKLKGYVLPTIYLLILGVMAFGITFLSRNLLERGQEEDKYYNYSMSVFDEQEESQESTENKETPTNTDMIEKPFSNDSVSIAKEFYQKDDTEENQQKALIYYENTYMPNTGILYECDKEFEILAMYDGIVKEIKTDEILGSVIKIEHNEKLTTIYYTAGEVQVKTGDIVKKGNILAKSGQSKLQTTKKQTLLLETYWNGTLTNPNSVIGKNMTDLN